MASALLLVVLFGVLLSLLPQFMGIEGIWVSVPLSNLVLAAVVLPMLYLNLRDIKAKAEVWVPISSAPEVTRVT
ncbi:hypothetical protein ACVFI8_16560 [Agarivorans sp. MS3-6]